MIAIEFTYHVQCLVDLKRRAKKAAETELSESLSNKFKREQAFMEIVDYVESKRGQKVTFKVSDLKARYKERLKSLDDYVHSKRFKEKLLNHLPDLKAIKVSYKHTSGETLSFPVPRYQALLIGDG